MLHPIHWLTPNTTYSPLVVQSKVIILPSKNKKGPPNFCMPFEVWESLVSILEKMETHEPIWILSIYYFHVDVSWFTITLKLCWLSYICNIFVFSFFQCNASLMKYFCLCNLRWQFKSMLTMHFVKQYLGQGLNKKNKPIKFTYTSLSWIYY